ncbi:MAG: DUF1801 domain-containing protein [Dehalococcoidia bacterium]
MAAKKTVDAWMANLTPRLREIAQELRALILATDPQLSEVIKWGNPCYEKKGRVCYLATVSDKYVNLGFWTGADLTDPQGLIEGTGAKMRHVKVRSMDDIPRDQFASWIREAIALNEREAK